jgi:hypothetical protein
MEQQQQYVDLFLWISHGGTVSSKNNYYPMEIPFSTVNMYSTPFKVSHTPELLDLVSNPCTFISGKCPSIPIINYHTNKTYVYLPPLVFTCYNSEPRNSEVRKYSGLYYTKMSHSPPSFANTDYLRECIYRPSKSNNYLENLNSNNSNNSPINNFYRLLGHNDIIDRFNSTQQKYITYSQIFEYVKELCLTNNFAYYTTNNNEVINIDPSKAVLGIFSCQSRLRQYVIHYDRNILNLIPKRIDDVTQYTNIIHSFELIGTNVLLPNTIRVVRWTDEFATVTDSLDNKGCGLNALSYLTLITRENAVEKAACLDVKGMSIFKIVDYLAEKSMFATASLGILILRTNFNNGFALLQDILFRYNNSDACIIKIYKSLDIDIGHTIIIGKNSHNYLVVDPQNQIFRNVGITGENGLLNSLVTSLYPEFEFMDILFEIHNQNEYVNNNGVVEISTHFKGLVSNLIERGGAMVVARDPNINYGGKKQYRKKIKKTCKKGQKRKNKLYRRKKSRKYIGGSDTAETIYKNDKLDDFEKIMIYNDSENGIQSALILTDL